MSGCKVHQAINAFYRQHTDIPRPQPENAEPSMVGIDPYACGIGQGEIIFGQLSPLHDVTLDDETKAAANIPLDSKYFAWAYPVVDDGSVGNGGSAEHNFLKFGGYVYFSGSMDAIGTNSIAPAPIGTLGLMFGRGQVLPDRVMCILQQKGRFQDITLQPLLEAGATHFAWIRPGEFERDVASGNGCFAYKFNRGPHPAKYFPVVTEPVFTAELVQETLEDNEAWVVVRPNHPTVEKIVMFDRSLSFNENMQQVNLPELEIADDGTVTCSHSSAGGQPMPYPAWCAQAQSQGTIADPWILQVVATEG